MAKPEDKNKNIDAARVAAVNKQLKDSVKSIDDLAHNMKIISKELSNQQISHEEYVALLTKQVSLYERQKKSVASISQYVDENNSALLAQQQHTSNILQQLNDVNSVEYQRLQNISTEYAVQTEIEESLQAQNTYYATREATERLTLQNLQAEKELQLSIMSDVEKSDEEKLEAQQEYIKKVLEEKELLEKQDKREKEQKRKASNNDLFANVLGKSNSFAKSPIGELINQAMQARNPESKGISGMTDALSGMTGKLSQFTDKMGIDLGQLKDSLKDLGKQMVSAVNGMIDEAARIVGNVGGQINAAVDGTNKTWEDFIDGLEETGISSIIKQTDILQNIATITAQGISADVEQIALLTTIKDKTVTAFNTTDSNLRRLVRLNQSRGHLTAEQFGLAAALRTQLNDVFGDSSFIGRHFQSLTGAVLDAVSANALTGKAGTNTTQFYSAVESAMATMYASGVSDSTINALAQGLNYLGSGNIQGLSGNKALQTLMLLSMDRAGLDYASILQQGLTPGNVSQLLSSIATYTKETASATNNNNVLTSSYANLFNISVTDMLALSNAADNMRKIAGTPDGYAIANQELRSLNERTTVAEKITNFVENAKFTFASQIVENTGAYAANLIGRLGMDLGKTLTDMGLGIVGKPVSRVSAIAWAGSTLPGVKGLLGAGLDSIGNALSGQNGAQAYFASGASGGQSETSSSRAIIFDNSEASSTGKKSSKDRISEYYNKTFNSDEIKKDLEEKNEWQAKAEEQEGSVEKILQNFEKTLMKANKGDGYAFAVSLQGMSDGVLRSFASIFADEDAMMETLTGKNNALKKNNTFINYLDDSSKKSGSASNTNAPTTATDPAARAAATSTITK